MTEFSDNTESVIQALSHLQRLVSDISPALKEIGEDMVESTLERFENSEAPDGRPWAINSVLTLSRKKGNKPLIGETESLSTLIHSQVSKNQLAIGSSLKYAAMQQFGGQKAEFPWLWGDIPARPFLGVSGEDVQSIVEVVNGYLEDGLK